MAPAIAPRHELAILDVAHGSCNVVFDNGGVAVFDVGRGDGLRQFLVSRGVTSIDLVLLSHADADHIGGLVHLLACAQFRIGRIFVNSDALKGSKIWQDLRYELTEADAKNETQFRVGVSRSSSAEFDVGGIKVEIVGPSPYLATAGSGGRDRLGRDVTSNSVSTVVRLLRDGAPMALLTGDLDEVGLDDLLHWGYAVSAKVLVFPHHGAGAGVTDAGAFATRLCQAVKPSVVVFSIGRGAYATPRPDIIAAVREYGSTTRVMCTQLSEHCARALPPENPTHLAAEYAQGREGRKCCAGTILVSLTMPLGVLPELSVHQLFISRSAPTALCRREPAA